MQRATCRSFGFGDEDADTRLPIATMKAMNEVEICIVQGLIQCANPETEFSASPKEDREWYDFVALQV